MGEFGPRNPAHTQQAAGIALNSPTALVGTFIFMLREYFTDGGLPWTYRTNATASDIIITKSFNRNTEIKDHKPGIYINRGQNVIQKVSTGYRDQDQPDFFEKGLEHFYGVSQTDIEISCVSPRDGSSAHIANLVQQYLIGSQYEICRVFSIRNFSPVVAGRTNKFKLDETLWDTPVSFRVDYETRWATLPIGPTLVKITNNLTLTGLGDPDPFVQMNQHTTGDDNT